MECLFLFLFLDYQCKMWYYFPLEQTKTIAPTPFKSSPSIMFYVYILKSTIDKQLYFGYTNDLKRRFEEHNAGKTTSTKNRRPFVLMYYEAYHARVDAVRRERMLKLGGKALGQLKGRIRNSLLET